MLNARRLVGTHDILLITLDSLRYDVAVSVLEAGQSPNLAGLLPGGRWECRHTPGSFTFSAHQAFFAGFLPTPRAPGKHARLFAAQFEGSETTSETTYVFTGANLPSGLAAAGYHTACIGGVGFFNRQTALGSVLPNLFAESYWQPSFGVTSSCSTERQLQCACEVVERLPIDRRVFLFINVSATHQPTCIFSSGECEDTPATQAAALRYVDRCLPPLFDALTRRSPLMCIICSDHGTALGENGYQGHRLGHATVWTVPYAEFTLPRRGDRSK
jgi:hypothetical protein